MFVSSVIGSVRRLLATAAVCCCSDSVDCEGITAVTDSDVTYVTNCRQQKANGKLGQVERVSVVDQKASHGDSNTIESN